MLSLSTARAETSEERPGAAMFCEAPMWIVLLREMMDRGCACNDLISKRTGVNFEVAIVWWVVYFLLFTIARERRQSYAYFGRP